MHQNNNNVTIARVNTSQACAACKYQRRKCPPDCILAPYFPHDRQRQFLNAHKLFGVSNITKIIRHLDQPQKDAAMRTIIFQSDIRANDPVGGCYRLVRQLQRQIDYTKAELDIVLHQLALCRAQVQTARLHQQQMMHLVPDDATDNSENIVFCLDPSNEGNLNVYQNFDANQDRVVVHCDDNISLQEFSDSWGVQQQGSFCSHMGKQPSPTHECCSENNISLQEVSDSWGMPQGCPSSHVPIANQTPDADFKSIDFSSNDACDLKFDYDERIEPRNEGNLEDNKATLESEGSYQYDPNHDFKDSEILFSLTKSSTS